MHDSKLGIVDQLFIPKRAYYAYRKINLGVSDDDNPVSGTATKVSLEPDLTYLRADGTDISLVIIALRDNNGKCINSNASVTLSLSGNSCTLFGPTTVNMVAGKLGVVLKSTETIGPTTITASSNGLANGTATITTGLPVSIKTPHAVMVGTNKIETKMKLISVPGDGISRIPVSKGNSIQVYNLLGNLVASSQNNPVQHKLSSGVYLVKIKKIDNR